jgi:hypothetical protein
MADKPEGAARWRMSTAHPTDAMRDRNMPDDEPKADEQERDAKIEFHYIKSNYFRVVHADGVWGGATSNLNIHMSFFSERGPIPQRIVHAIEPRGVLGGEIAEERISRKGVVREVEVDVVLNLEMAVSLRKWLDDKIKNLQEVAASAAKVKSATDEETHGTDQVQ